MRPVNYPRPALGAEHMRTYAIVAPPDTLVVAACEEVGCAAWLYGWDSIIDESTDLGRQQAAYIRGPARRTFRELRRGDGLTVFRFDAKQRCFAEHRTRPEIYSVRDGDFRGNPRGTRPRVHTRAADWVDDFATHQQQLADRLERG